MPQTGSSTLDQSPAAVAEWVDRLEDRLGWHDRRRTLALLRGVLHAIRDFLTPDEAADLAAQLPVLLRGVFYEDWVPSRTPAHFRNVDDFLARAMDRLQQDPPVEPDVAISAVFDLLRQKVGAGEYDQVAGSLRKPLRDLWT